MKVTPFPIRSLLAGKMKHGRLKGGIKMPDRERKDKSRYFIFLIPLVGLLLFVVYNQDYRNDPDLAKLSLWKVFLLSVAIPLVVVAFFLFIALAGVL